MTLSSAFDEFILDKQCDGLSKRTIASYNQKIMWFIDYVDNIECSKLTLADVKKYVRYLQNKTKPSGEPLSSGAIQTYIRHLRVFLNYLYNKKYTDIDFLRDIKLPKAIKKVEEILTDDEIILIFAFYRNQKPTFYSTRNVAVISLLLDTGIRADELCNIKYNDVNFDYNYIKIRGKGAKERMVKLSPIVKRYIYRYLKFRRIKNNKVDSLFVNKSGEKFTYNCLKKITTNLKKDLYIDRIHPHLFRHTFATRKILVDGVDLFTLQVTLGHETLDMTRKYSHLASQYQVIDVDFKPLSILIA